MRLSTADLAKSRSLELSVPEPNVFIGIRVPIARIAADAFSEHLAVAPRHGVVTPGPAGTVIHMCVDNGFRGGERSSVVLVSVSDRIVRMKGGVTCYDAVA
jgi:hypothetical protein